MNDSKEVQVVNGLAPVVARPRITLRQKVGSLAAGTTALVFTLPAHAGVTTDLVATFKTEVDTLKADNLVMWGIAGAVLIAFAIWRYAKRGINTL